MLSRLSSAAALSLLVVTAVAGQTVRFDTNVGNFDLELNPTSNENLQPLVDNMLDYVEAGRYDLTVINRADTGFVMQMGGFLAESIFLPNAFGEFNSVETFDPVIVDSNGDNVVDFDVSNLNNTRSTVSLALSSLPSGQTNVNSGTSSFFVNLGTNASLDGDFVPFANVNDMATIDLIMSLDQANYSDGGLAGDNVPALAGGHIVFVERAYVLPEDTEELAALATATASSASTSPAIAAATSAVLTIPEPSTIVLAAMALFASTALSRRRLK